MRWIWKSAVALAILGLAGVVMLREFGPQLATYLGGNMPSGKSEAHESAEHGQGGHEAEGKEHAHGEKAAPHEEHKAGGDNDAPEKMAKAEIPAADAGHGHGGENGHGEHGRQEEEGLVKLSAAQLTASGIETAPVASGTLIKEIAVPGRVGLNLEKQAKVVSKVAGTVATINKRLGEPVLKDEALATIESREIANAKAEYLEMWRSHQLTQDTYEREERLWKQKVTAEQEYRNAKNAYETAKIKFNLAHQKLHTIGLAEETIENLSKNTEAHSSFRTYELRAPISGQITARDLVLGQIVTTDKEIFTIADLSSVWVELAIQPADLAFAKVGQEVRVVSGSRTASGKIVILSPVIDPDTRSAKAIAEIDNAKRDWNLGDSVNAQLISGRIEANLLIPREAIQTIKGQKAVFVNEAGGFKLRPVTTGREDSAGVEIVSGLEFGETIATKNTFRLKAELGKAEAEHEH